MKIIALNELIGEQHHLDTKLQSMYNIIMTKNYSTSKIKWWYNKTHQYHTFKKYADTDNNINRYGNITLHR